MIRLFIIEDHPIIVQGLRNHFRPKRDGIEVSGSAATVEEMIETCDQDSFDILIFDLWLGESNPLDNVKLLTEHFPVKPIVVYTSEESRVWKRKMILAGVKGYIIKSAVKSEIKMVLEKISKGEIVLTGLWRKEDDQILRETLANKDSFLREKQRMIVVYISEGLTHKEIANRMGTCTSTVDKTARHLRTKFSVKTNAELIKFLTEKGII